MYVGLNNRLLLLGRSRPFKWPTMTMSVSLVISITGLFLLYVCYVGDDTHDIHNFSLPLQLSTRYSVEQMQKFAVKSALLNSYKPHLSNYLNLSFNRILDNKKNRFNINGTDVVVFIHIQKTAGTSFERFLVKYLNVTQPCVCNLGKKRCRCNRPSNSKEVWLFSRYSTGWACGLHSDFTEMVVSNCVEHTMDKKEGKHKKRRYYYTTFLRDPVERFISEFSHVQRGANWLSSRHLCNGKFATPDQLPLCFDPQVGWEGVNLNEFLACKFNLAFNRQTRMLADLTLVNCYNWSLMDTTVREKLMLESAKKNLKNMAFFGIKERMNESQFLFENIFNLKFTKSLAEWNKSKSQHIEVSEDQLRLIKQFNVLDIQLYKFATKLFDKRLAQIKPALFPFNSSLP